MEEKLCSHLRALLCPLGISESQLSPMIGKLNDLLENDPDRFKQTSESISRLILKVLATPQCVRGLANNDFPGLHIRPKSPPTININPLVSSFIGISGPFTVLERCLDIPLLPSERDIPHMRALIGMTKLKTAYPADKLHLTQREANRIWKSISYPNEVPDRFQKHWKWYLQRAIPLLIRKCFDRELEIQYDPVPFRPRSDKMSLSLLGRGQQVKRVLTARSDNRTGDISILLRIPEIRKLYELDRNEFCRSLLVGDDKRDWYIQDKWLDAPSIDLDRINVGYIAAIPNDGFKFRVVAVPVYGINSLCFPLEQKLMALCKAWDIQGVTSHEGCCRRIHHMIRQRISDGQGGQFHSIDMTSFTDRLPYKGLQDLVLLELLRNNFISEFDVLAYDTLLKGSWRFLPSEMKEDISVRYVGTPMGTYPSFPLASLTNGLILTFAEFRSYHQVYGGNVPDQHLVELSLNSDPGRIIGDDTVIFDDRTANYYTTIMEVVGVPMSPEKCITSTNTVEFCSKIINQFGVFEMKRIGGQLDSSNDLMSLVHMYEYYGHESHRLSGENLDEYGNSRNFEILKEVVYPFGLERAPLTYVRKWRGSLGHSVSTILAMRAAIGNDIPMTRDSLALMRLQSCSFRNWIDVSRTPLREYPDLDRDPVHSVVLKGLRDTVNKAFKSIEALITKPDDDISPSALVEQISTFALRVAEAYDLFVSYFSDPVSWDESRQLVAPKIADESISLIQRLYDSAKYDEWNKEFLLLNMIESTNEVIDHERTKLPFGRSR